MNKTNLQNLSDEQIDGLANNLFRSVIVTDEEIDDIADSPRLWWQVQSNIAAQNPSFEKHRFFFWNWRVAIGFAMSVIILAGVIGVEFYNSLPINTAAVPQQENIFVARNEIEPEHFEVSSTQSFPNVSSGQQPKILTAKFNKKFTQSLTKANLKQIKNTIQKSLKVSQPKAEAATEFIALSYLPVAESGQIVRVKVPRSMMVSLGVTTNTERSTELVNAEIILGDDGATNAIRFIGR